MRISRQTIYDTHRIQMLYNHNKKLEKAMFQSQSIYMLATLTLLKVTKQVRDPMTFKVNKSMFPSQAICMLATLILFKITKQIRNQMTFKVNKAMYSNLNLFRCWQH